MITEITEHPVETIKSMNFEKAIPSKNIDAWIKSLNMEGLPAIQDVIAQWRDIDMSSNPEEVDALAAARFDMARDIVEIVLGQTPEGLTWTPEKIRSWWQTASIAEIDQILGSRKAELYTFITKVFSGEVESLIAEMKTPASV